VPEETRRSLGQQAATVARAAVDPVGRPGIGEQLHELAGKRNICGCSKIGRSGPIRALASGRRSRLAWLAP